MHFSLPFSFLQLAQWHANSRITKKNLVQEQIFFSQFLYATKLLKKPHSSLGDFFEKGRKHNFFHDAACEIEKSENPGGEDEARRPFLKAEGD